MVLLDANLQPQILGLEIGCKAVLGVALKVGYVEAVLGEVVDLGEELPGICNSLFLY